MRLGRLGDPGHERPVVFAHDGRYADVSAEVEEYDGDFFGEPARLQRLRRFVAGLPADAWRARDGERIGAPVARPHQILCVGLNFADHAEETGQAIPTEPIIFNKAPNTLVGPDDAVRIPRGSQKTDWEVELAIVIGERALYLDSEADAWDHIAGFMVVNDVSEREFQMERGGQWVKGKSAPTFNPAGPYLVTPDEIVDVSRLGMWLDVDGVRRQTGSTATMIFSPTFIVHHLSQFMALEPGDIINTGTPPGVGMGQRPPVYLHGGEVMSLGIDGLGAQTQSVLPFAAE